MSVTINGDEGVLVNGAYTETVKVSTASSYAPNPSDGTIHWCTPTAAMTLSWSNLANGKGITLGIQAYSTVTFPSGTKFFNGSAPTVSTSNYTILSVIMIEGTVYCLLAGDLS